MKSLVQYAICLFLCFQLNAQTSVTPSGSGTAEDPYQIASLDNLYWLSQTPSVWSYMGQTIYFIQTQNIVATDTKNWNSGSGFTPIALSSSFAQNYDGRNYNIDGLFINLPSTDNIGLFSVLAQPSGSVANLNLTNVDITGQDNVGSLVGSNGKQVTNTSATGKVSGGSKVGGLIGSSSNGGGISNSYSAVKVTGTGNNIGGVCGNLSSGVSVTLSFSIDSVSSSGNNVGGIAGNSEFGSSISNCYSRSHISGSDNVGGLLGTMTFGSSVSYSFSTGTVTGTSNTNGLIGSNPSGSVGNSFCDTTSSGIGTASIGTGESTSQMKLVSTYLNSGWDFSIEATNGENDYWTIDGTNNDGYPYLVWQTVSGAGLPVELSSFELSGKNLIWSTATESNNSGWEIEITPLNPPVNGGTKGGWRKIGFVSGKGTTTEKQSYTFSLSDLKTSSQIRLKQIDLDGKFSYSPVIEFTVNEIPAEFSMSQNYPNPFNPSTIISYKLSANNHVKLVVYDLLGREIRTLVNEAKVAGKYTVNFFATDLPSGVYFYKLTAGDFTSTKKMMLVK